MRKNECLSSIEDTIKQLRLKSIKMSKKRNENLHSKPVAFWIKEERLMHGRGKEFTIILRTKGCKWALGNKGGCTMCGYIQDACISPIEPRYIIDQFEGAFNQKLHEIRKDKDDYVLKLFNSGSFFDDEEISEKIRRFIYERVAREQKIKEVVIESRPEFITQEKLREIKTFLKEKQIEIGIGLETVNDEIRNRYINKGFTFNEFLEKVKLCNEFRIGVKVYLLFKPPFLNEQAAIDDCENSLKTLKKLPISTISINPMNVQRGTLVEYLWLHKRYRPPWFYSLIECLKNSLTSSDLARVRILSDPSGAGTRRGIHNCLKKSCNDYMLEHLKKFVLSQELKYLDIHDFKCDCKIKFRIQKHYW
ncbi:MAG: archaeosine biosynthesis radical SAM protein RaSEA [Promethearchaeota archaeon]